MYLTPSYFCFHANILGFQTTITIPLSDVRILERAKTALVIPNAIQITTSAKVYFFASFVQRELAFGNMEKLLRDFREKHGMSNHLLLSQGGRNYMSGSEGGGTGYLSDVPSSLLGGSTGYLRRDTVTTTATHYSSSTTLTSSTADERAEEHLELGDDPGHTDDALAEVTLNGKALNTRRAFTETTATKMQKQKQQQQLKPASHTTYSHYALPPMLASSVGGPVGMMLGAVMVPPMVSMMTPPMSPVNSSDDVGGDMILHKSGKVSDREIYTHEREGVVPVQPPKGLVIHTHTDTTSHFSKAFSSLPRNFKSESVLNNAQPSSPPPPPVIPRENAGGLSPLQRSNKAKRRSREMTSIMNAYAAAAACQDDEDLIKSAGNGTGGTGVSNSNSTASGNFSETPTTPTANSNGNNNSGLIMDGVAVKKSSSISGKEKEGFVMHHSLIHRGTDAVNYLYRNCVFPRARQHTHTRTQQQQQQQNHESTPTAASGATHNVVLKGAMTQSELIVSAVLVLMVMLSLSLALGSSVVLWKVGNIVARIEEMAIGSLNMI
jgi:hypothetical protein